MTDPRLVMIHLIQAAEKIVGDDYKIAGFGNGGETYCLIITESEYPGHARSHGLRSDANRGRCLGNEISHC